MTLHHHVVPPITSEYDHHSILPFEPYLIVHPFLSSCCLSENNNRLFALEPEAKRIFGFGASMGPISDSLMKSARFTKHAKYFIQMIDKALGMLGPDIELLTEILLDLGAKHVTYGVKPEYFPSMGRALLFAVKERLGDEWTDEVKDAWVEVYGALSYDMIRGQKKLKTKE
jgi:hemoglobin-like flavoprotein